MVTKLAGGTGGALEAMDWLKYPGFGRFQMADIIYSMQQLTTREQIEVLLIQLPPATYLDEYYEFS